MRAMRTFKQIAFDWAMFFALVLILAITAYGLQGQM
jgi:hypothetical protein